jgi:1-acyl-sn-glycerol-3-phosphate acyltransferase
MAFLRKITFIAASILLWTYFFVSSLILTPIAVLLWLLTVLFDKNLRVLHLFSCFWGAQYIWIVPFWSLKIYDRNKYDNRNHYILVSNHQSFADILVVYSLFKHFRWTSKAELFKIPFVGWVLSLNRSLKVYRGANDAYQKLKEQAVSALRNGNSIMVFPEGTRSRGRAMGKFKDGAFRLAHETKTDILPLVIDGTSKVVPKTGWILTGKEKMVLKVLDPVPYEDFNTLSFASTSNFIREKIEKELVKIRSNSV